MNIKGWEKLNEYEQLGNIGSAFFRASKGATSYDEFSELLDLTIADPKWKGREKELIILRDVVSDLRSSKHDYQVSVEDLNNYFMGFAVAARKHL